mgnify:CR=1 FL=1
MLRLNGHKGEVCATSACNGILATSGHDKTIFIWDPSNSKTKTKATSDQTATTPTPSTTNGNGTSIINLEHKIRDAHDHIISTLEIYHGPSFNTPLLISGSWDGDIKVWDFTYRKNGNGNGNGNNTNSIEPLVTQAQAKAKENGHRYRKGLLHVLKGHSHRVKSLSACDNHLIAGT